jgi:hypothetical protein
MTELKLFTANKSGINPRAFFFKQKSASNAGRFNSFSHVNMPQVLFHRWLLISSLRSLKCLMKQESSLPFLQQRATECNSIFTSYFIKTILVMLFHLHSLLYSNPHVSDLRSNLYVLSLPHINSHTLTHTHTHTHTQQQQNSLNSSR